MIKPIKDLYNKPIWPVTHIDAVIDNNGRTLRQILGNIPSAESVQAEIDKIIKDAPEALDTLKEVADYIEITGYNSVPAALESKTPVTSVVQVASGTSTINATIDNYYNIAGEVGTIGITLPTPTDITKVKSIMFNLTTGSTPAITFSSSSPIDYFASYEIEANASYEVHALWNGSRWIVGATEINITSNQ